jgi:hypothetical protein
MPPNDIYIYMLSQIWSFHRDEWSRLWSPPCSLVGGYRCFRGTQRLYLRGETVLMPEPACSSKTLVYTRLSVITIQKSTIGSLKLEVQHTYLQCNRFMASEQRCITQNYYRHDNIEILHQGAISLIYYNLFNYKLLVTTFIPTFVKICLVR